MREITLDKVQISQDEYQDMLRVVKKLEKIGIKLDYTVSKPNHKRVGVKFNQQYDLEALCKQVGEE